MLGAITPVVLQVIRGLRQAPEDAGEVTRQRWNPTEILAALYALLPQGGLQFGLFPWPLTLVLIFLAGWLVLALLIGVFLPWPVTAIAATLQEHTLRTGLVGVLSYGVVLILAAVFTVSIIGIPLTVMVLVLAWGAQLLGMVSIAALVGRRSTTAMRRPDYSNVVCILIGGIILGLVRIIPVFGWIAWLLLGIFGFGAVILTQGRAVRGGELGATGI